MEKIFLSVVIPCYDEMANLQKGVLDKVVHFLTKQKYNYEVLVVDDGSQDGSSEFINKIAKEYQHVKLIRNNHTGKAGAVTAGVLTAKGKYILFTDMDQAAPIEEVNKLLPYFDDGYSVVIGSRSRARKGSPVIRLFISRAQVVLRTMLVGLSSLHDTQCGFKMFEHTAAKEIFTKVSHIHQGFQKISGSSVTSGFDVELLLVAHNKGYTIKEVPIEWLYVETRRVNPVKDSIEGVKELLKIRMNARKGLYS